MEKQDNNEILIYKISQRTRTIAAQENLCQYYELPMVRFFCLHTSIQSLTHTIHDGNHIEFSFLFATTFFRFSTQFDWVALVLHGFSVFFVPFLRNKRFT